MEIKYEQQLKFFEWHTSQKKWHCHRSGKWHLNQSRWHNRQLKKLPLSFIVTHAFRKNLPAFVENIITNNILFKRFCENNVRPA